MWNILQVNDNCGIQLTESLAMNPAASVCGLYFAHPKSEYFSVGKLCQDQVSLHLSYGSIITFCLLCVCLHSPFKPFSKFPSKKHTSISEEPFTKYFLNLHNSVLIRIYRIVYRLPIVEMVLTTYHP